MQGCCDATTAISVVHGEAASGKSTMLDRLCKMLYPDRTQEGGTVETEKSDTHGADGQTEASMVLHDGEASPALAWTFLVLTVRVCCVRAPGQAPFYIVQPRQG